MAFLRSLSAQASIAGLFSGANTLQEAKTLFTEILELDNRAYLSDVDKTKINEKFIALLNKDFVDFRANAKYRLIQILLNEKNWLQPLAITKNSFDDLAKVKKDLISSLDQINDSNLYLNFALQGFCANKTLVGKILNMPTSIFGAPSMLKPNSTIGGLATTIESYLGNKNHRVVLYPDTLRALQDSPEVVDTLRQHFPQTSSIIAPFIRSARNDQEEGNRHIINRDL